MVARDDDGRKMGLLRWGLVPFWADDPGIGNRMINARSETASEKPAFRQAFRRRRCLVAADGFFEWRKEGDDQKTPFWIHRSDRRPFGMAGIWERWEPVHGDPLFTYAILTRDADDDLRQIHPRMPVLLDDDAGDAWLDPDRSVEELEEVLAAPSPRELTHHPVSTVVNSPRNDGPECIAPVGEDGP